MTNMFSPPGIVTIVCYCHSTKTQPVCHSHSHILSAVFLSGCCGKGGVGGGVVGSQAGGVLVVVGWSVGGCLHS
jgi:hypothetical protein